MIRVVLPAHLRTLAHLEGEVKLDVQGQVTQRSVLDALEAQYPMLCGTLREIFYFLVAFAAMFGAALLGLDLLT